MASIRLVTVGIVCVALATTAYGGWFGGATKEEAAKQHAGQAWEHAKDAAWAAAEAAKERGADLAGAAYEKATAVGSQAGAAAADKGAELAGSAWGQAKETAHTIKRQAQGTAQDAADVASEKAAELKHSGIRAAGEARDSASGKFQRSTSGPYLHAQPRSSGSFFARSWAWFWGTLLSLQTLAITLGVVGLAFAFSTPENRALVSRKINRLIMRAKGLFVRAKDTAAQNAEAVQRKAAVKGEQAKNYVASKGEQARELADDVAETGARAKNYAAEKGAQAKRAAEQKGAEVKNAARETLDEADEEISAKAAQARERDASSRAARKSAGLQESSNVRARDIVG